MSGIESGVRRVIEVIFGCVVALVVSWLIARIWPVPNTGRMLDPVKTHERQ
jgi:uncharacterized membrane protein YccC